MVPLGAVPFIALMFLPVRDFDIPWYMDHPAERRALIRDCENDWRLARSWTCNNAHAAEMRSQAIEGHRQDLPKYQDAIRKNQFPPMPVPHPAAKGGGQDA